MGGEFIASNLTNECHFHVCHFSGTDVVLGCYLFNLIRVTCMLIVFIFVLYI